MINQTMRLCWLDNNFVEIVPLINISQVIFMKSGIVYLNTILTRFFLVKDGTCFVWHVQDFNSINQCH